MKLCIFVVLLCGALSSEIDLMKRKMIQMEDQMGQILTVLRQGETRDLLQDKKLEDLEQPKLNDTDLEQRVQILEVQVSGVQDGVAILDAGQLLQDQKILGTQGDVSLLSTGLLTTQESVSGLEDTAVELDSRLDSLELGGSVAFHVALSVQYPNIPAGSIAVFDAVELNLGEGYNVQTGEFTVPSGGAGLYYLYAHFLFNFDTFVHMYIRHNSRYLCAAFEDTLNSVQYGGSSCGAVVQLNEGDIVDVYTPDSPGVPVHGDGGELINRNSFSGFRITAA